MPCLPEEPFLLVVSQGMRRSPVATTTVLPAISTRSPARRTFRMPPQVSSMCSLIISVAIVMPPDFSVYACMTYEQVHCGQ